MRTLIASLLLFLAGCIGPDVRVENPREAVALATINIRNIAQEAESQYAAGRMSEARKNKIVFALQGAWNSAQAAALALAVNDETSALAQLQAVRAVLRNIEEMLREPDTNPGYRKQRGRTAQPADNSKYLMDAIRGDESPGGCGWPQNLQRRCAAVA